MTIPIKIIKKSELKEPRSQEAIWNAIAKPWSTYVVKDIPFVVEFLKDKKGKIIDFGCGCGRNMIPVEGIDYWGVDFSQGQVDQTKKHLKRKKIEAKLFKGDISKLDKKAFKTKMFDYGLFISTLHCIEGKAKREKALKEFYRILKPGGEALISVWNSKDKRFDHVGNKGDIYMDWKEHGKSNMRYYYLYSRKELQDLVKKIGFKIVEFYKPIEFDRFSRKNYVIRVKK